MENNSHIKKVLITADTVGGVWTYAVELIKAMRKYNIHFYLATMGAPLTSFQREQIEQLENVQLFKSEFKLEWMDEPWEDVRTSGQWLMYIEENVKPDIVHLNGYAHATLPFTAPRLVVAHSCVYSWFDAVWNKLPDEKWNRYRNEVTSGLQSADLVTAPSYAMLSILKKFYGNFHAAEPIYNCVDPDEFLPEPKEPFVLSAGRLWDEAKNIKALIDIASQIKWPVYAAGDNYHPVNNNNVSFNTYWIGSLNRRELTEYMSRASIFVLPALYEPFGLSILEAAYSGCALVLSNIPSLREIWKDSAVFVDPGNKSEIAEAVNNLIDDRKQLEYYSSKAKIRAARFTPDIMAEKYFALYNKLIHKDETIIKVD